MMKDLVCPICEEFSTNQQIKFIAHIVRKHTVPGRDYPDLRAYVGFALPGGTLLDTMVNWDKRFWIEGEAE